MVTSARSLRRQTDWTNSWRPGRSSGDPLHLEEALDFLSAEVLNASVPVEARRWTLLLLDERCTELTDLLMNTTLEKAHLLRDAACSPELLMLALTPDKAALALRFLERGSVIDKAAAADS